MAPLDPPPEAVYDSIEAAEAHIQQWAEAHCYATVRKNSSKDKFKKIRKIWIACDSSTQIAVTTTSSTYIAVTTASSAQLIVPCSQYTSEAQDIGISAAIEELEELQAIPVTQATQRKKRGRPPGGKDRQSRRIKANPPFQAAPGTLLALLGELQALPGEEGNAQGR